MKRKRIISFVGRRIDQIVNSYKLLSTRWKYVKYRVSQVAGMFFDGYFEVA